MYFEVETKKWSTLIQFPYVEKAEARISAQAVRPSQDLSICTIRRCLTGKLICVAQTVDMSPSPVYDFANWNFPTMFTLALADGFAKGVDNETA